MTDATQDRAAIVDPGGYISVHGWTLVMNKTGDVSFKFGGKSGGFQVQNPAQLALCAEQLAKWLRSRAGKAALAESRKIREARK